jgi:hypothetical protein
MSVVQPGADLLVLTETGYGKRVSIELFREKHRGGQGVRLISLEGRKTGVVAAVQQVTEMDEELVLISAQGQVVRTELDTVNRYSPQARGVIVMRLNEGDRVVGIAAFRPGLAEGRESDDNDAPDAPVGSGGPPSAGSRERRVRSAGGLARVRGPVPDLHRQTRTATSPRRSAATSEPSSATPRCSSSRTRTSS